MLLVFSLVACATETNNDPVDPDPGVETEPGVETDPDSEDDQSSDSGSDTLTVYSPHPAETINLVIQEFEEQTGIKVEIVAAGTGELLKRVESESDNPLGDVLWGGGA